VNIEGLEGVLEEFGQLILAEGGEGDVEERDVGGVKGVVPGNAEDEGELGIDGALTVLVEEEAAVIVDRRRRVLEVEAVDRLDRCLDCIQLSGAPGIGLEEEEELHVVLV
jgi:hypothetical protein